MKHIIIRTKGSDNLPAMLFYKQYAIAGDDGQVILYQVLKRGDGLYDTLTSTYLAKDIKYKNLRSLTNAVIDKLFNTTLWDVFIADPTLFDLYDEFQILDKNKTY
ncbi:MULTISPECIES: hypothetical protein [Bacillus]|uniref:hypothetical protein n=1 Tax=Bacillus TaxID=1386 RepID=UPI001CA41985|nr:MULTISPECIES: hypothetical protein [Bacillus]MCX2823357.1 hypothetical protein [Bacillus sp. H1F1]MDH3103664.1 hypothetical protein [Bacillus velezensis]QZY42717.1 hypothetical protein K4A81_06260 [Bacillus velezensis]